MKTVRMCRLIGVFSLLGLLRTAEAGAGDARYRYVSLDNLPVPQGFAGFFFGLSTIADDDRVYGNLCNDAGLCYAAVAEDGALQLLQPKDPGTQVFTLAAVRKRGVFGGSVSDVADPLQAQAAILRNGTLEIVPASPVFSFVAAFTDSSALVDSFDATFTESFFFYEKGKLIPLDLSQIVNPAFLHVNRRGIMAGTQGSLFQNARGFRLDPRTGKITQLDPLPTEPLSWGLGINARGDVLGYSFISGQTERIGIWDREGRFQTYFVEGIAEFPTVSNRLLFNDDNLIAITQTTDGNSYIVPEPGVRVNLADITDNLPTTQFPLSNLQAMNNRGSLAGFGLTANQFLLHRTDGHRHCEDDDDQGR
jgi:hypothetical protein